MEVQTDLPHLNEILSDDILRKMKPKEKKRQEVINGKIFSLNTLHLSPNPHPTFFLSQTPLVCLYSCLSFYSCLFLLFLLSFSFPPLLLFYLFLYLPLSYNLCLIFLSPLVFLIIREKNLLCFLELFHTERAHMRNMKILDQLFNKPMLKTEHISQELVKALFPNLEKIISLHRKYLSYLIF